MLKKMIDKIRKKLIRSLGGSDFPQDPPKFVCCKTIKPQVLTASGKYHIHRIPPVEFIADGIAENIMKQLVNNQHITYSVEYEGDYIIVRGSITTIFSEPMEGETSNVEEVMEKIRVSDVRSRSGSSDI